MSTKTDLMQSLGALFSEAVADLAEGALKSAGGDRGLALAILRSALCDLEAIHRADFIGQVYEARKRRSETQSDTP